MTNWLTDNQFLLTLLGQLGSFFSGVFAAIAAMLSLRAIGLAKEESIRNRISFEFSWQPMLKSIIKSMGVTTTHPELLLPRRQQEIEAREMPQQANSIAGDFAFWRKNFGDPDYASGAIDSPHPNVRYLLLEVDNLQPNPSGQAIDIRIEIEFFYPSPKQSLQKMNSPQCLYNKEAFILLIEHIGSLEHADIYLADIESVPNIRAYVKSLVHKTWNDITVTKGIIGGIDFSAQRNGATNTNIAPENQNLLLERNRTLFVRPEWVIKTGATYINY